jgi:hypothetical protein
MRHLVALLALWIVVPLVSVYFSIWLGAALIIGFVAFYRRYESPKLINQRNARASRPR